MKTKNILVNSPKSGVSFVGISATKKPQQKCITYAELAKEARRLLSRYVPNTTVEIAVFMDWDVRRLNESIKLLRKPCFKLSTKSYRSKARGLKLPVNKLIHELSAEALHVPLTLIEPREFYRELPASHPLTSSWKNLSSCSLDLVASCSYPKYRYNLLVHTIAYSLLDNL